MTARIAMVSPLCAPSFKPMRICGAVVALLGSLVGMATAEASTVTCSRADSDAVMVMPALGAQPAVLRYEAGPIVQAPDCWAEWTHSTRPSLADKFLIDVRPPEKSRQMPIPGALQIKLSEILGKGFLRQENLVLVGTGYDTQAIGQTCVNLRKAGFRSVFALKGGARTWSRTAGTSDPRVSFASDEMSSAEFAGGIAGSGWNIWTVDLDPKEIAVLPVLPAKTFSKNDLALLGELLAQELRSQSENAPSELVVIAKNQKAVEQMKLSARNVADNIFWLHGGLEAYSEYVKAWQLSSSNAGASTKKPCGAP